MSRFESRAVVEDDDEDEDEEVESWGVITRILILTWSVSILVFGVVVVLAEEDVEYSGKKIGRQEDVDVDDKEFSLLKIQSFLSWSTSFGSHELYPRRSMKGNGAEEG